MTPTQKKFLKETLGVEPKTKLIGKGDDQVQATTAFNKFREREAAVIKKLDDLRKIGTASGDVVKYEKEVEAAQAQTKTAKKGDFKDVKAKCEEAEGMLANTEKAVIFAIKAQTDPKLKPVLAEQSVVEAYILKVESSNAAWGKQEIATARSNVAAALAKAHPGKDPDGAVSDLIDARLELEKAAKAAYKLSKTAAESAMNALTSHADKDLVTKETTAIQTDLLDKAVVEGTADNWAAAKKLYDEATKACNDTKALAQKVGTDNFKNYKTWGLDKLKVLTSHAQKTVFADDIARIEKKLEAVRAAVLNGVDNLAQKQMENIYWDCERVKTEMDRHGVYLAKRLSDYDPKKTALPANTDPDFAKEVDAIEKQLVAANKRADRRQYDDADKRLAAAIAACVDLQKLVDERKAYNADLKPVGDAVGTLPGDEDPVIGKDSKAVRLQLAAVKNLATAKDFKTAKERLPEVQKACDAAKKLAANQSGAKNERDAAVGKDDPAVALAEVRKMYNKLGTHAQAEAIKKQLEEIDKKLKDADTALKA
jgi:hypothetical protein